MRLWLRGLWFIIAFMGGAYLKKNIFVGCTLIAIAIILIFVIWKLEDKDAKRSKPE